MSDPVLDQLSQARQQLLDLSARNRLLNFRPTRRTTVEIVDELPGQVWRLLVTDRRKLSFLAHEEHVLFGDAGGEPTPLGDQPQGPVALGDPSEDDAGSGEPASDGDLFTIPDIATALEPGEETLPERHTDLFLQTPLTGDVLQTNLLQVYRQAGSVLEERGVNLLFLAIGLLEWSDADHPGRTFLAPLVLVPVAIERTSARRRFKIHALDDDPVINPCLHRKLKDFRLDLPLVDSGWDDFDVEAYLDEVRRIVSGQPDWQVHNRLVLGFFSFTKYLMYVDLDPATWPDGQGPSTNTLVRAMCGDEQALPQPAELPSASELDLTRNPEEIFQVLDADSSQMEAIYAALQGQSLVIEGPPGTGKSQTIANIIAECLAAERTVLFVSEKMAALDVVKRRLGTVGLGDFCLELHSTKANRKSVVAELGERLEQGRMEAKPCDDEARKLSRLKEGLAGYVAALSEPFGPAKLTPYDAMGRVIVLADVPDVPCPLPGHKEWDRDGFDGLKDLVARLGRQWLNVAPLAENPWCGTRLTTTTAHQRRETGEASGGAAAQLDRLTGAARDMAKTLDGAEPTSLRDVALLHKAAQLLLKSPRPPARLARDGDWDDVTPELTTLLDLLSQLQAAHQWMDGRYHRDALQLADWPEMHSRCLRYWNSPWRFLRPTWWSDRSLLRRYRDATHRPDWQQQADDLARLVATQKLQDTIDSMADLGRRHFDDLWQGSQSDPATLLALADWLTQFRQFVCSRTVGDAGMAIAESGPDSQTLAPIAATLADELDRWNRAWDSLSERLTWQVDAVFGRPPGGVPLATVRERLLTMAERTEDLIDWTRYQEVLQRCEAGPLAEFVARCAESDGQPETLPLALEKRFLNLWMESLIEERPPLREFSGVDREAAMEEFARLDQRWLTLSRYRLQGRLASRRPGNGLSAAPTSQLGVLQGEIRRKRGGRPIRRLLADAADAIQRLTPCLMMSPLSVAQFLEPGAMRFDVVIFDEASQVEPADALGAIARGSQLILVGDPKQLPPTAFFSVGGQGDESPTDGAAALADMESILDRGMAVNLSHRRLRWHYRSRHESLIAFSNREFYNDDLVVFPSSHFDNEHLGLKLVHEPEDFYTRGRGINREQARRVAARVFELARMDPDLTLGVGAFNISQQQAILDELEHLRRDDESLETFFARDEAKAEPFFVKNLETIQGDERDVILLSIGYGRPDKGERLSMNFGPLNKEGGWRRLNVLITRARRRCEVFSSVLGEAFDLAATSARGPHALKRYIDYARNGALPEIDTGGGEFESPFEQAVYNALVERGHRVHCQVGCRGYAIDLAVIDPERPGRYLLGIECDGASYHSSATARDRDRLRQQVLERLGWRIWRVWSTDWFRKPQRETERLLGAVEMARAGRLRPKFMHLGEEIERDAVGLSNLLVELSGPGQALDVGEYHLFTAKSPKTPEEFYSEPLDRLTRLIASIVKTEGPIHLSELARRVSACYGFARTGSRIERRIERSVGSSIHRKRLVERSSFLWPADMTDPPVRHRSDDAVHDIDLVCDEEIARAAGMLLRSQFGMSRDDLVVQVARLLGFQVTGLKIRQRVETVIADQLATGGIVEDGQRLVTPSDPPANESTT